MKELTKIDYSCLVGSQVLMEFSNDREYANSSVDLLGSFNFVNDGVIANRQSRNTFDKVDGHIWRYCRIYQHPDYEIGNATGDLVLPVGLIASCITRAGAVIMGAKTELMEGGHLDHSNAPDDIISVQVTGPAEGYEE